MQRILAGIVTAACLSTAHANLIANPSNESALNGDQIPGWTMLVGSNWMQRSANPNAFDGDAYFFAGAGANGTLRQVVDVSSFAATIDASSQNFLFSGYVHSFAQSPADSSRIVLSYLASEASVLATFDSGEIRNTSTWQQVTDNRTAPALTRSIQVDLVAKRYSGTFNDGYFDALSIVAAPVPEPAAYLLMSLGLACVAACVRQRAGDR